MFAFQGIFGVPATGRIGRVVCALCAALALSVLTACGGGGSSADDAAPISKSFSGTVTSIDSTTSLQVGGVPVSVTQIPAEVKVGSLVEVDGVLDGGVVRATSVRLDDNPSSSSRTGEASGRFDEFKGRITSYASPSSFSVGNIVVNASNAGALPSGLGVGSLVEVHGVLSGGVFFATRVEREDDSSSQSGRDDDASGHDDSRGRDDDDDRSGKDGCDDDVDPSCDD